MKHVALLLSLLVLCHTRILAQSITWIQQPAAATGTVGGYAEFSFVAQVSVAFANLGIVAYKTGAPGNVSNRFTITSQSVSNLITTSGNSTRGEYTVRIANLTSADVGSYSFDLTVNNLLLSNSRSQTAQLTLASASLPTITTQPLSQTISSFSFLTLSVQATGVPAPSYQWYRNGSPLAGQIGATYSVPLATARDAGVYHVVVTNSAGSVTSSYAILNISAGGAPVITRPPESLDLLAGQTATFSVSLADSVFTSSNQYQWILNGTPIIGATNQTYSVTASAGTAGSYSVMIINSFGSVTSSSATLRIVSAQSPQIVTHPAARTVGEGESVTFSVLASGTPAPTYQWRKDGVPIPGATASSYAIAAAALGQAGLYSVTATNSAGSITSNGALLTIIPRPASRISNLSVRTPLANGQSLIVGFVVKDSAALLLRAVGPTLGAFGLTGVMADPRLAVYRGSAIVAQNEDWGGTSELSATSASVGAFALPAGSRDAALRYSTEGGSRSLLVSGNNGGGIVLVELYDSGGNEASRLANVSARNHVGQGDDILILGFVVSGSADKRLLIRGIGPTLSSFGVTGALSDPRLVIYSTRSSTAVASNDNWDSSLSSSFDAVAAFRLSPGTLDAALITTLPPGAYTAQLSGVNNSTGEALVEIYELP